MFFMFLFTFLFCFEPALRASETPKERLYKTILNAKSAYLDNTQSKWKYNPSLEQIKTVMRNEIMRLENLITMAMTRQTIMSESDVTEAMDKLAPLVETHNTISRAIKTKQAAKNVITLGMLRSYYTAIINTQNNAEASKKLMELNDIINYAFVTNIPRCGPAVEKRVAESSTIDHAQEVYPAAASSIDTRVKIGDYVWVPKKKLVYENQQVYAYNALLHEGGYIRQSRILYKEETIDDSLIQKIYPPYSLVPASSQPGLVNYSLHNKTIPLDCTALAQGQPAYPGIQYYLQQKQNNSTSCNLLVFNALTATEITCPLPLSLVVKAEDKPLIDGSAHYAAIAHNGQYNCLDIFQLPHTAQKATMTIPRHSQEQYCDVQQQKKVAKSVTFKQSNYPFTAVGLGQLTPVIAYAHYDQGGQAKVCIEMLPRTEYAVKKGALGCFKASWEKLRCLMGYTSEKANYWDKEDTVRKSLYYCSIPTNSPIKKIVQADYRKFMCLTASGNLYTIEFDRTNKNGGLRYVQYTAAPYEDIMIDYKNNNAICLKNKLM